MQNVSPPSRKLSPIPVYGLTGMIGSGKSTVARHFEKYGIPIIDADVISRELVTPGNKILSTIVAEFGSFILSQDGALNRKALASLIFKDVSSRRKLEEILHPHIRARYLARLAALRETTNAPFIIYVVPLLFESNTPHDELAGTIVVTSSRETCISRIVNRDSCSKSEAESRYASQLPLAEKIRRSDFIIANEGEEIELIPQVEKMVVALTKSTL